MSKKNLEDGPTIVLKDDNLKALRAAFKTIPKARVGVLGRSGGARAGTSSTNAAILAAHEAGTSRLPRRSVLVVPLKTQMQGYMEKSGLFKEALIRRVIKERSIFAWVEWLGAVALRVVDDGFETRGFGKWKPSNMARKKVKQTLVETGQLRRAISVEVTK